MTLRTGHALTDRRRSSGQGLPYGPRAESSPVLNVLRASGGFYKSLNGDRPRMHQGHIVVAFSSFSRHQRTGHALRYSTDGVERPFSS